MSLLKDIKMLEERRPQRILKSASIPDVPSEVTGEQLAGRLLEINQPAKVFIALDVMLCITRWIFKQNKLRA